MKEGQSSSPAKVPKADHKCKSIIPPGMKSVLTLNLFQLLKLNSVYQVIEPQVEPEPHCDWKESDMALSISSFKFPFTTKAPGRGFRVIIPVFLGVTAFLQHTGWETCFSPCCLVLADCNSCAPNLAIHRFPTSTALLMLMRSNCRMSHAI